MPVNNSILREEYESRINRLEEQIAKEREANKTPTDPKKVKEYDATEFEIRMFVADYKIRK